MNGPSELAAVEMKPISVILIAVAIISRLSFHLLGPQKAGKFVGTDELEGNVSVVRTYFVQT